MESGLVNLRAELHKKKVESSKTSSNSFIVKKGKFPFSSKKGISSGRIKKLPSSTSNDELKDTVTDTEESLKLEQSRKILEEKAKLYDKLKGGTEVLENDELNDRFLINFQEKIVQEVNAEQKEIKSKDNKERDHNTNYNNDAEYLETQTKSEKWNKNDEGSTQNRIHQQRDLEVMKEQEKLNGISHQKWDEIEEESRKKTDVHYQDVLFDEARSHGVGFMQFSRDEEERKAQHKLLKNLRAETIKAKNSKEAMHSRKEKLMKERLTKVRQRKRLKMGLPMKEMEDDKLKTPPASDEEVDETKMEDSEIKSPNIAGDEPKLIRPVREWDLGKIGTGTVMSQQQWVESKRKIRETEFAPPSLYEPQQSLKFSNQFNRYRKQERITPHSDEIYKNETQNLKDNANSNNKNFETPNSNFSEPNAEFAPPPSFEYYGPSVTKKYSSKKLINLEEAISKGLSNFRKESS